MIDQSHAIYFPMFEGSYSIYEVKPLVQSDHVSLNYLTMGRHTSIQPTGLQEYYECKLSVP